MSRFTPSSPHLFRPVRRGFFVALALLAALALASPAPLEVAADPGHPPNPAKAAWFLVWIQELVSHSTAAIHVALALGLLLVALPWLPLPRVEAAAWFQRPHRPLA
ncbi:MAG: cytochrome B6, partial [Thermoanaerobaculia bacterium]|nr:cytochrome B6 [Thermoanaerobaculia bacterium]